MLSIKDHDTIGEALPNNVTHRKVFAVHKFDRETGDVTATVRENRISTCRTCSGRCREAASRWRRSRGPARVRRRRGAEFASQNLAERTYDQAGSYLVKGLDSFIGDNDGENVEVITNAGRAYIKGSACRRTCPQPPWCQSPRRSNRSAANRRPTWSAPGAMPSTTRLSRKPLRSRPSSRSSPTSPAAPSGAARTARPQPGGGYPRGEPGRDGLSEGADWQQSGNYVDWLGSGNERPSARPTPSLDLHQTNDQGDGLRGRRLVRTFGPSGGGRVFLSGHRSERHRRDSVRSRQGRLARYAGRGNQPSLPGCRSAARPVTASIAARRTRSARISSGSRTWPPGSRRTSMTVQTRSWAAILRPPTRAA